MKSKILITVENGRITSAVANGNTELHVNVLETLDGPQRVHVVEITNEKLETLLRSGDAPVADGVQRSELNVRCSPRENEVPLRACPVGPKALYGGHWFCTTCDDIVNLPATLENPDCPVCHQRTVEWIGSEKPARIVHPGEPAAQDAFKQMHSAVDNAPSPKV